MTDPRPSIPGGGDRRDQEGHLPADTDTDKASSPRGPHLPECSPDGARGGASRARAQSLAKQQRTGQAPRRTGSLGVLLRPRAAASRGAAHPAGALRSPILEAPPGCAPLSRSSLLPRFAEAAAAAGCRPPRRRRRMAPPGPPQVRALRVSGARRPRAHSAAAAAAAGTAWLATPGEKKNSLHNALPFKTPGLCDAS